MPENRSKLGKQQKIMDYIAAHTTPQDERLLQLERSTHLQTLAPQMISGHIQGRLLSMISRMIGPSTILEIGTFTGYSALCLAEGLAEGGVLHTIEGNREYQHLIKKAFADIQPIGKIQVHFGDALDIIPKMTETFDLVFIDAAKQQYVAFYHAAIDKMKSGGYLLADNVLWSGKVADLAKDEDTKAICAFNSMVQDDPRVENLILPVRDGMMICRKR
ncbi:MAG: O-methyltransferase [Saprospiraceae bacterium]|nr:O-methyltransferase [Saprospiraceae bacterium]